MLTTAELESILEGAGGVRVELDDGSYTWGLLREPIAEALGDPPVLSVDRTVTVASGVLALPVGASVTVDSSDYIVRGRAAADSYGLLEHVHLSSLTG